VPLQAYESTRLTALSESWVFRRLITGIAGSNPAGDMDVCRECCALSGRGLYIELIIRPEEFY